MKSQVKVAAAAKLSPFLAELLRRYHSSHWIASDPIQYAHRYSSPEDRELAAFLAACFAYGNVKSIHKTVERILAPMGTSPAGFVRRFDGVSRWPGFYHRFHREGHLVILVAVLRAALEEYGSLGGMFRANAEASPGEALCERVLNGAAHWLRRTALEKAGTSGQPELAPGFKFLFNAPEDGSACKRMAMFLRWMVRRDEIDFGLWAWFPARELVIPVDTHVGRIAYYLRLRRGKEDAAPNWKMAREITAQLGAVNPDDPVAYDFALARLGILDICKKHYVNSICERCPVAPGCRYSQMKARLCA